MSQHSFDEMEQPKLSSTLNVLTILTIIGCVMQFLSGAFAFFQAKDNFLNKDKMLNQFKSAEMPAFIKSMIPDPDTYEKMVTLSYNNRVPIFILTLVGSILCFMGALQMRKLKRQGFVFYLAGTVIPFLATALFVGLFMFKGFTAYFMIFMALLFVALYYTQRKRLVY